MLNKLRSKFPQDGYDPAHVHASTFETTSLSEAGYALLSKCLAADPKKRVATGKEALDMQYFQAGTAPALQRVDEARLKGAKEAFVEGQKKEAEALKLKSKQESAEALRYVHRSAHCIPPPPI